MRVVVAWKPADIMPFVGIVVHRADALRETFGFLPERAYWDMAEQGKLLVAVGHDDGDQHYLGHLLFDGTFPHGRVLQTHVEPKHRGRKVGKKLVQALVRRAEAAGFLSLRARVASDLRDANAFYDRMGFLQIQKKRGGRTRKREICIRVRELDTPNLLDWAGEPHRPPQWNALAHIRQSDRYVLDLNVLFDTVKRRPRSEASAWIVGAALNNIIRLAVTEELVSELERNTSEGDDPILEFARKLPRLATAPEPFLATVTAELAALIFPQRHASDRLTVQDRSDLIHLATSVYHQAAGFITAEKAILRAGEYLRRTYGINIIGPDEFVAELEPIVGELSSHSADVEGALLTAAVMNDERDHDGVLRFIDTMFVPVHERPNLVSRGATGAPVRRLLVKVAEDIIAVCSFQAPTALRPDTDLRLCADQDHPHARSAIEYLVDRVCREASSGGPAIIRLHQLLGHALTREVAVAHGFHAMHAVSDRYATLHKASLGGPVTTGEWKQVRTVLKTRTGICVPPEAPAYAGPEQPIAIETERATFDMPLIELETLLSPAMFLLSGRDGVIVPIRREFAEFLFGPSRQIPLLAGPQAALLRERTYFCSMRAERSIRVGMPIVFYESGKAGGLGAATVIARVIRTERVWKDNIADDLHRRGVLTPHTMSRMGSKPYLLATTFDNITVFGRAVSLTRLRRLGCVSGANLVTATPVSAGQVEAICEEGRP